MLQTKSEAWEVVKIQIVAFQEIWAVKVVYEGMIQKCWYLLTRLSSVKTQKMTIKFTFMLLMMEHLTTVHIFKWWLKPFHKVHVPPVHRNGQRVCPGTPTVWKIWYFVSILGAFTKLQKATIIFFMSIWLSSHTELSSDFQEIWYLSILENMLRKFKFH